MGTGLEGVELRGGGGEAISVQGGPECFSTDRRRFRKAQGEIKEQLQLKANEEERFVR